MLQTRATVRAVIVSDRIRTTRATIANLRNSAFIRNILLVMSGSAVAQAIGFGVSPVISRLFSPADFGVFGTFGAFSGVLAAIVTLDYSQAVMLPKQREDAGQIFLLSCIVTLAITLLCVAACLFAPGLLLAGLKSSNPWLLVLLIASTLVGGINVSLQAWCVRTKAFKSTSASQVIRGVSSSGLQIGLGSINAGAMGLVFSSVAADFVASLNLYRVIRADVREFLASARWKRLVQLGLGYGDFPVYSAGQNLLNALSMGIPVLLLTHYYGLVVAGAYAFSMRILNAPMLLILGALRQVLFQKAGETQHQNRRLTSLFLNTTIGLFALGIVPSIAMLIWSPPLFAWFFGEQWRGAGELAQVLTFWLLISFCNLPAVLFARLIRIQRAVFFYNLILLAARTLALVLGGIYLTALHTVLTLSVVGGVMNLALIVYVGNRLMRKEGPMRVSPLQPELLRPVV